MKKSMFTKSDRSLKGSLDKPIELLVTAINQSDNFYTTSSCSGRIVCKSLEYARTLLRCSIDAGQRNSGLNISNSGHITVAIRNTLDLEVPLIINNKLMVNEDYLRELITIANEKLISNFEMIQRFFDVCEQNDLFRSLE
ncbi:tRNA wybutosine-synthesizing protein 3 -like protein [Sarcoptes scabiei]|uniref:tRNA wybutosine-synthesizing protein 3 homolog n=1 Tax=Sarcoptes scabiei TaxID=52283 RepID=A0A834VFY7_SARSC|nr:tRNA wybutosine-synthesizing protein 3 -like protein [Sarcoptes scabiei]